MIAISACLVGKKCRYNATDALDQALIESIEEEYLDLCPELLGGFSVPRPPCEIVGGEGRDVINGTARVLDCHGNDVTEVMLSGAKQALDICKTKQITKAYLKQNSPACGCGKIYDGSFSSVIKEGNGIFAEYLLSNNIKVVAK